MKRIIAASAVLAGLATASGAHAGYAPGCTVALDIPGAIAHEAHAVAIQADGKIVVAGYADLGAGLGRDILVARLHPDLTLDTSFNGTGYRVDDLQGLNDEAFTVAVQYDQKVVIGGYSRKSAGQDWYTFARYNRDGSPDASFGSGGFAFFFFTGSQSDEIRGLAIQPDGKILGAGLLTPSGIQRMGVVRLTKDGNLDPSFDGDGGAQPAITGSSYSYATDVAVQPDGRIVVSGEAGFASSDFVVARLMPDGSLDNSFNLTGWVATDFGAGGSDSASSLVIQGDRKIVLGGTSDGNAAVVRYLPAGAIDGAFGSGGLVVHDFGGTDSGNALAVDGAANLLVAGVAGLSTSDFAFARFQPNGTLDSLSKTDDISGMDDRSFAITVTSAGKLLVVGSSQGPTSWKTTLALYLPDGSQDCGPAVYPVDVFTAASSGDSAAGQVMLNWLNPSYGPYAQTVIRRDTAGCPATTAAGVAVTSQNDGSGAPGSFVDTVPLGATYYYSAFVMDSLSQTSTGVCKSATPFDRTVGKVEWIYDTSISALTTPGLRLNVPLNESVAYSVANDGLVHAIRGGPITSGGGSWPNGWRPFRIGGSAQERPPIVPLPLPTGATPAVLLGSQDGHVYAVDALTGDLIWKSPRLGMTLQAAPAVALNTYGAGKDLVFIGTRETASPNRLYALNADDGTVAWFFDNGAGPNAIGMIVGDAFVDYTDKRVYFTSALGASGKTVWCLNYTTTPPTMCWSVYGVSPLGSGDIEASPIFYQGSVFVSDTALAELYAVNPLDGSDTIFFNLGDGGAKGFVFPEFGKSNLFASTSTSTMSVKFGALNWADSCVATPSTPIAVPFTDWIFVGSSEGKLFQYSAGAGMGCPAPLNACIGDCLSTIVGAPTYDILKTMLYVGTVDGTIYAVRPPF